jgi:hypothetical protein
MQAPALAVYQSLWAMQPARPDGRVLPLADCVRMAADAGYDGVGIDLWATDIAEARALGPLLASLQLGVIVTSFPRRMQDIAELLALSQELGADFLNIIGQVMPLSPEATVPVIYHWMEAAHRAGIPLQFETHRNCFTNDMFTMLRLIDDIPELVVCADLSHYVVGREFDFPINAVTQSHIARILARSGSFQGRVATRQQVQVPFEMPQYRPWFEQFKSWWAQGFADWRQRHPEAEKMIFLCELGPPDYAITGADGIELSDRWEEALVLRDTARALWRETGR